MAPVATAISRNLTSHATVLTQGYGGYKLTRSEMMINKVGINVFKTITSGIAEVFPNAWASYYGKKLRS